MNALVKCCRKIDKTWIQRARKINTLGLLSCMATNMHTRTPVHEIARPTTSASDSAVSRALRKIAPGSFKRVFDSVSVRATSTPTPTSTSRGARTFALDGSKVPLPPSLKREGFRVHQHVTRRGQGRPMGLLSCLVDVETRQVLDYRWGAEHNERVHAHELFASMRRGDTVVMDRGYYSAALVRRAHALGVLTLFRMKRTGNKHVVKWLRDRVVRERTRNNVWSVEINGVPARLFSYRARGTVFLCLTTSPRPVTDLKRAYRKRWAVETSFRTLKTNVGMRNMRTTSSVVARHYIDIALTLYALSVQRACSQQAEMQPTNRWRSGESNALSARTPSIAACVRANVHALLGPTGALTANRLGIGCSTHPSALPLARDGG